MPYEIAHCRHATEGAVFKALVHKVLIGRKKEKTLCYGPWIPPLCQQGGEALARFSSWAHAEFRLQYTSAMGKTLGT